MMLWNPVGKRLILHAIRRPDGSLACDLNDRLYALAGAWAPTFGHKTTPRAHAKAFASQYMASYNFDDAYPPSKHDFVRYLKHVSHSSPGVDGLPYCAWRAAGQPGVDTLFGAGAHMQDGGVMELDFNIAVHLFPPKGEEEGDEDQVIRDPESTRPLALRNSDSKIIAGVANGKVKNTIAKYANPIQKGFVIHRDFLEHVVASDALARILGTVRPAKDPILAAFDSGSAFPSLTADYLEIVMEVARLPTGCIDLVMAMYNLPIAMGCDETGTLILLFLILSGVLQGCPLSGSLFVLAMDPVLGLIDQKVQQAPLGKASGFVGGCADDVGAVVDEKEKLCGIACAFKAIKILTGLSLKHKKCFLVLLSKDPSASSPDDIKRWLKKMIPSWADFQVTYVAKYLGLTIGPGAGKPLWQGPLEKWMRRALSIGAARSPPWIASRLYLSRAQAVPSYVAQLAMVPASAHSRQFTLFARLMHMPFNSLTREVTFNLHQWTDITFQDIRSMAAASQYRAATKTLSNWQPWMQRMKDELAEFLPLSSLASGSLQPPGWDTPPFAEALQEAAQGFPSTSQLKDLMPLAIAKAHSEEALAATEGKHFHLQAAISRHLHEAAYPDTTFDLTCKRLSSPGLHLDQLCMDKAELQQFLKSLPPSIATPVFKTWMNAWATSSRMQNEPRLCCFGCNDQPDQLSHCLCLWPATASAVSKYKSMPDLSEL